MRRGFSLPELLVAVGLMAILLVLASGGLNRGTQSGAGSKGLATVVAGELTAARQRAMANGRPVAVGFPSAGGGMPVSQSLYFREGDDLPRTRRVVNFSGDFPQVGIFVGLWPTSGAATLDRPATASSALDVDAWCNPPTNDFLLVFSPDGGVFSNDLPLFDGQYHLVVGGGMVYTSRGAPPGTARMTTRPSYFSLSSVAAPATIRVDPCGSIAVDAGLTGLTGGVQILTSGSLTGAAPAPALTGGGNAAPTLQSVELFPEPHPESLSPGTDANVGPGGYLTLIVRATDNEGDRVDVRWAAQGPAGPGTFSTLSTERVPSSYVQGSWRSVWEWRPPSGAIPGEVYQLTCTLSDERGASVTATSGAGVPMVAIRREGWIAFPQSPPGEIWRDIYLMCGDGTRKRNITNTPNINEWDVSLSADGTRVAYARGFTVGNNDIFTCNPDGSGEQRLTFSSDWETCPSFSPGGDQLLFVNDTDGWSGAAQGQLTVMSADGSNRTSLGLFGYAGKFSPDGLSIVYDQMPFGTEIRLADYDPITRTVSNDRVIVPSSLGINSSPRFHAGYPGVPYVIFDNEQAGNGQIFSVNTTSLAVTQKTSLGGYCSEAFYSPDGSQIVLRVDQDLAVVDDPAPNLPVSGLRYLTEAAGAGVENAAWSP